MEIVELTNMCMVYSGNRVVLQERVNGNWNGLAFPGGHVEKGESFTDSVIREVFEETGLTIRHPKLCAVKDWPKKDGSRYIVLCYKTDEFSGTLKDSEEGKVCWVNIEDFPILALASDMPEMLNMFLDDNISEFYYYLQDGEYKYKIK